MATDNLVFVSSAERVYAVDIATRKAVWSYSASGSLALSPNGILYIAVSRESGRTMHAINLQWQPLPLAWCLARSLDWRC